LFLIPSARANGSCRLLSGGAFCGYFPSLGGDFVKDSAQKVRDRLPGGRGLLSNAGLEVGADPNL